MGFPIAIFDYRGVSVANCSHVKKMDGLSQELDIFSATTLPGADDEDEKVPDPSIAGAAALGFWDQTTLLGQISKDHWPFIVVNLSHFGRSSGPSDFFRSFSDGFPMQLCIVRSKGETARLSVTRCNESNFLLWVHWTGLGTSQDIEIG